MAANAPVVTCCETVMAALVGVALAPEAAAPDPEAVDAEVATLVAEVAEEEEDSCELPSIAVAFSAPHCWLFLQPSCPSASFGFAAMHCAKVSWQI
jgi:hypothetical protein